MRRVLAILVIMIFLVSCAKEDPTFPTKRFKPEDLPTKQPVRPVIEKVDAPPAPPPSPVPPSNTDGKQVQSLSTPFEEYKLSVGYGHVGINSSLGAYAPPFSKYEFPELLKSRNVVSEVLPVAAKYEQFLRLLGGRVKFSGNNYDTVRDYLVYEDDEEIFEYEFILSDGTFLDYIDQEIIFLGYPYFIKDATKQDVILINLENGNEIVIGGGKVILNGWALANTDSRMTGSSILLISRVDADIEGDDIFIEPGASLQEFLGDPTLLTDKIDIRYLGIEEVPHATYKFNNKRDEIELEVKSPQQVTSIPLAFNFRNGFRYGDEESKLHIVEAANLTDYKIKFDDYFVLTAPGIDHRYLYTAFQDNIWEPLSVVFRYKGINPSEKTVEFASPEGVVIKSLYSGTFGNNAYGTIPFAGREFGFYISNATNRNPILVDQNGDGRFIGSSVKIMMEDAILEMPSQETFNQSANITLRLMNYGKEFGEERVIITINPDFTLTFTSDLEIIELGKDDDVAVSAFGTHYFLLNQEGKYEYEDIVINHPLGDRLAEILIESR